MPYKWYTEFFGYMLFSVSIIRRIFLMRRSRCSSSTVIKVFSLLFTTHSCYTEIYLAFCRCNCSFNNTVAEKQNWVLWSQIPCSCHQTSETRYTNAVNWEKTAIHIIERNFQFDIFPSLICKTASFPSDCEHICWHHFPQFICYKITKLHFQI